MSFPNLAVIAVEFFVTNIKNMPDILIRQFFENNRIDLYLRYILAAS